MLAARVMLSQDMDPASVVRAPPPTVATEVKATREEEEDIQGISNSLEGATATRSSMQKPRV